MSENLYYNRDRNIAEVTAPADITGLQLTPSYGSSVTFKSKNTNFDTDDFYYELVPLSVNNLSAQFQVKYDLNTTNARKLVNFFEAQSGYKQFEFNPDNSGIYKNISGFCDEYTVNFSNYNHNEVGATITVDGAPSLFNWSGQNFTNLPLENFHGGTAYKKYDVVYTGISDNKLDNFYYASEDHSSNGANSPSGTGSKWSQSFFFEPDERQNFQVGIKADILDFKYSFPQRLGGNAQTKNIAKFDISYNFTDLSDAEAKAMLHFLENKAGYRRFEHSIPSLYNRPKVYYCPEWTHTWKYANANDISVSFIEDPLGVVPTGV
jgi:phage-related protein